MRLHQYLKNENGSALVMVLLLATALGILGMGLLYALGLNHYNTSHRESSEQAYYSAEAGIIYGKEIMEAYELASLSSGGNGTNGPQHVATVEKVFYSDTDLELLYQINIIKNAGIYEIVSIGKATKGTHQINSHIDAQLRPMINTITQGKGKNKTTTYYVDFSTESWIVGQ